MGVPKVLKGSLGKIKTKTSLRLTLRLCKSENCQGECFCSSVELIYDHCHEVESTTAWNFLEVEESARLRLIELFEAGLTPSRAKLFSASV